MGLGDIFHRILGKKEKAGNVHCPYNMSEHDWKRRVEKFQDCLPDQLPWSLAGYRGNHWPRRWNDQHVGNVARQAKDALQTLARIRKAILKCAEKKQFQNASVEIGGVQHNVQNLLFFYVQIAGMEMVLGKHAAIEPVVGIAAGNFKGPFEGAKTKQREAMRLAYNMSRHVLKHLITVPRSLDTPKPKEAKRLQKFYLKHKNNLVFDHATGFFRLKDEGSGKKTVKNKSV